MRFIVDFETIRGSLMTPKWQKLASLAQEICTLCFHTLVQSLLVKDNLLRTYWIFIKLCDDFIGCEKVDDCIATEADTMIDIVHVYENDMS